jgi:hypothetical protein
MKQLGVIASLLVVFQAHAQTANGSSAHLPPTPPWDEAREASIWKKLTPRPTLGCRFIMETILEAVGTPGYQARSAQVEKALEQLESMQDLNPSSKTFGNFHWYWREEKPGDLNAVEFVIQRAVLLKLLHADRLSPKASEVLDRILTHAVEGIHRQKVGIDYTNIYLMKTWNLLALGQALKRPDLSTEGSEMLDAWIAFTRRYGITEYLSPTYVGIDLDSLGLMANHLDDPVSKGKASGALLFLWQNIAANWFYPAQRLGGAHGRDYDYLTGHGELDRHLRQNGWIPPGSSNNTIPPGVFASAASWSPPEDLHRQALSDLPRLVTQRCGTNSTDWASQQLGHHVSLGVAGTCKGPEDKPFAVNLAGPAGPKTVMVNFFMDGRDDPYGSKKVPTGASGHSKAHHLDPIFRAVQSGSDVLFLSTYPGLKAPSRSEPPPVCLHSHLDIPEEAIVWSLDHPLDTNAPIQALPGNLCFLRLGDVAVGIRFLLAEDTSGKPVAAELINDGSQFHAKRLSVTHSATPPGDGRATVGVAVRTGEGLDDAGFAEFRRKFETASHGASHQGSTVLLNTQGMTDLLVLEADLSNGKVLRSKGGNPAVQIAPLSINGKKVDMLIP